MKIGNIECYGIIYKITNKINNRCYIGQTTMSFKERYSSKGCGIEKVYNYHKNKKKRKESYNSHLIRSIEKYGFSNWVIIEIYDIAFSKIELDIKEKYYIELFDCINNGYNNKEGGSNGKPTNKTINKLKKTREEKGLSIPTEIVRRIKLSISCLMDRKEVSILFNVSEDVIKQICNIKNYKDVNSELNYLIKNIKTDLIKERNTEILKLFDNGYTITEISKKMELSTSIVEKCVYKYRDIIEQNILKRQKIYDNVMRLYKEGMNPYQISKTLNIGNSTVHRYIKDEVNPYRDLPYKKIKSEDIPTIIDMYFKKNKTIYEICNKFKVSRNTIENIISHYKYVNTEVS